jgi:hypothetical protein
MPLKTYENCQKFHQNVNTKGFNQRGFRTIYIYLLAFYLFPDNRFHIGDCDFL